MERELFLSPEWKTDNFEPIHVPTKDFWLALPDLYKIQKQEVKDLWHIWAIYLSALLKVGGPHGSGFPSPHHPNILEVIHSFISMRGPLPRAVPSLSQEDIRSLGVPSLCQEGIPCLGSPPWAKRTSAAWGSPSWVEGICSLGIPSSQSQGGDPQRWTPREQISSRQREVTHKEQIPSWLREGTPREWIPWWLRKGTPREQMPCWPTEVTSKNQIPPLLAQGGDPQGADCLLAQGGDPQGVDPLLA